MVIGAFWAVSVCNADGLNPYNAYSVYSITVKGTDGSIASSVPAVADSELPADHVSPSRFMTYSALAKTMSARLVEFELT